MKHEEQEEVKVWPSFVYNIISRYSFLVGAGYGVLLRILASGKETLGVFTNPLEVMSFSFAVLVPIAIGAITVYSEEQKNRRSFSFYIFGPWVSVLLGLAGTALIMLEGSICIAMAAPLFLALSSIGGLVMGLVCRYLYKPKLTVQSIALLPLIFALTEIGRPLNNDIKVIKSDIHIAATPEAIWRQIEFPKDIQPNELEGGVAYWVGVPYPVEAQVLQPKVGGIRHSVWQRGVTFDEEIIAWEKNRHIAWKYHFNEDSFPPGSMDDHVAVGGKYFDLEHTSYTLIPEPGGTRLEISVKIRVSTGFNWYAKPLATFITEDTAATILNFYKNRAESANENS
jgi:hypothetical protein